MLELLASSAAAFRDSRTVTRALGSLNVSGPWFLYIARCSDGSLYTGIALNVARRLAAHNAGRGARYTRGRGPLALCAHRRCPSKGDALRLEIAVKRLARPDKERLLIGRRLAAFARRLSAQHLAAPA